MHNLRTAERTSGAHSVLSAQSQHITKFVTQHNITATLMMTAAVVAVNWVKLVMMMMLQIK